MYIYDPQSGKSSKKEWQELRDHVQIQVANVAVGLANVTEPQSEIAKQLDRLNRALNAIAGEISQFNHQSKTRRWLAFATEPKMAMSLRKQLDDAISSFQVDITYQCTRLSVTPPHSWVSRSIPPSTFTVSPSLGF
jgi:chromosome segregation ATPase